MKKQVKQQKIISWMLHNLIKKGCTFVVTNISVEILMYIQIYIFMKAVFSLAGIQ